MHSFSEKEKGGRRVKGLFNNRKFVFLWMAQAASGLGSTFSTFVLSWLVYKLTGSKVAMGSVWVAFMLPNIIIQMFAGPFLDRWERKKVMIFSEWFRASAFLLPIILYPMGQLETWHLYLVSVATVMLNHSLHLPVWPMSLIFCLRIN